MVERVEHRTVPHVQSILQREVHEGEDDHQAGEHPGGRSGPSAPESECRVPESRQEVSPGVALALLRHRVLTARGDLDSRIGSAATAATAARPQERTPSRADPMALPVRVVNRDVDARGHDFSRSSLLKAPSRSARLTGHG